MALIRHHYIDGAPSTLIADAPAAKSVTKAASRIFAAYGETVKYCAAGAARDWTTANNAGFLPVQLQQDTGDACVAVGTFRSSLGVFFPTSVQVWSVAVDPTANAISDRLYGIGTLSPLSMAGFARDLAFLSPFGFRSMVTATMTDSVDSRDIGVPVDALVRADMLTTEQVGTPALDPLGIWIHELGQYWLIFDLGADGSKAWVYSFSKADKLACWSDYTFAVRITGACALNGQVYVRTDSTLYEFDPLTYTDDGAAIDVEVQMAFQDAKTPGVDKQFYGADYALAGTWDVAFKYDPRDEAKETISQALSGDTRPGNMAPVEVVAPSIAPVFRHSANEGAEVNLISLYYNPLSVG